MRVLHVFDFWECVPRSLASGVAPLRAYRKSSKLDLNFARFGVRKWPKNHSNRTRVKNPFWHQAGFLLKFWGTSLEPTARAEGVYRPSGFNFFCQLDICLNLSPWILFYQFKSRIAQIAATRFSLFLSLNFIFFPKSSPWNPRFCSLSHLNLST